MIIHPRIEMLTIYGGENEGSGLWRVYSLFTRDMEEMYPNIKWQWESLPEHVNSITAIGHYLRSAQPVSSGGCDHQTGQVYRLIYWTGITDNRMLMMMLKPDQDVRR